jgi:branched-chain amino acid aminotransferase
MLQTYNPANAGLIVNINAKLEANAAGADDALLLDTDGNLADTSATHVFPVNDGVVRTPTTKACPQGITRMTDPGPCEEHGIPS